MREAVIGSTARTPIERAYRGAYNDTGGVTLAAHVPRHAAARARLEGPEIEDVILGCALQQGATGFNVARQAALRAGFGIGCAGITVDRQCGSGLQAIAWAAQRIIVDGVPVCAAGGVESVSLVQNEYMNGYRQHDEVLKHEQPGLYLPMLDTAEVVARRYAIPREAQDVYARSVQ